MEITIKALSPDLINDYLALFDNMTFSENPDWSKCYCYSYHFTGANEEWEKEKNRSAVIELIKENKMRGYLAFDGIKPVGWCNVNDKNNYQLFGEPKESNSKLCAIVCFIIAPEYRRKGIAKKLLKHILEAYTLNDYKYIESYPRKEAHSCEKNYHGHLSMYEKEKFIISEEFEDHYIARKKLNGK